mmetsp:Transcript_22834/g.50485  ORF Transcript_22834/g.50485 Transcript_22834/m.50485 type:complete len:96 (+) Transcript_22834:147-434(+)
MTQHCLSGVCEVCTAPLLANSAFRSSAAQAMQTSDLWAFLSQTAVKVTDCASVVSVKGKDEGCQGSRACISKAQKSMNSRPWEIWQLVLSQGYMP